MLTVLFWYAIFCSEFVVRPWFLFILFCFVLFGSVLFCPALLCSVLVYYLLF